LSLALSVVSLADAAPRSPTNDEVALLVLANESRAYPAANRNGTEPIVTPLVWHQSLANAALSHSEDMAANQNRARPCFQHDSCNGGSFQNRMRNYYPGWMFIAENIAYGGADPRWTHDGWMDSNPHRSNILHGSMNEFGAGNAAAQTNFGVWTLATENLGQRGMFSQTAYPAIVAATVIPTNYGTPDYQKDLILNYYHYNGVAPRALAARVGNTCISNFAKTNAAASNWATYKVTRTFSGNSCIPVVFEAIRSDGKYYRYPATGSIQFGVGSATWTCPRVSNSIPSADCGLGSGEETPGEEPENEGQIITPTANVLLPGELNQKVEIKFEAKENGSAKAGVRFAVKITSASGTVIKRSLQSNKKGIAYFKRNFKRKTEAGVYSVLVTATYQKRVNKKTTQIPFGDGAATQFSIAALNQ